MLKNKLKPCYGKIGIILTVLIVFLTGADILTKYLEEAYGWSSNGPVLFGLINIKSGIRNQGCAFSFLDDNPQIGQPIFITLTFIMLAVMIFAFICLPNRFLIMKIAISLIIAGAAGNLYDRIAFFEVRDWFGLWMFGRIAFCNLADFWIVIGAALAIVDLLFLNEAAVFPLTKSAKAAQAARKEEEDRQKSAAVQSDTVNSPDESAVADENSENDSTIGKG